MPIAAKGKNKTIKGEMRPSRPILVAVVGGSGAGKNWLADRLEALLHPLAARLSLDDFYLDRSHLPLGRRALLNFDHPRAIEWPCVERAVFDYLAGRPTKVPCYDFATHSRRGSRALEPKPILLMDGLWLLRRPSLRGWFSLRIFVECPASIRLKRRLARDLQARGRGRASVLRQFRTTVEPMHRRFVAPQARWADVILHEGYGEDEIGRLATQLRNLLR